MPFGIFVKSPTPMRFCVVVNAQWSVATTCREPAASPAHSPSWWALLRNGGDMTRRAAWSQSGCAYSDSSRVRCWISGSPNTRLPFWRARRIASWASSHDTCTT